MRAVFLGTPSAAVPSLAALMDVVDVVRVVTQPDRARGRSGMAAPPHVKTAALEWGIPVSQPDSRVALEEVLNTTEADLGVVVAYGRILSPTALDSFRYGFVNVHFSLLPRWRGAAPVERAILAGDVSTGVTLMQLDQGLDTGPVLAAVETPIGAEETGGSLTGRLSYLGAMLIDDMVPGLLAGNLDAAPQLRAGITVAPRLEVAEGRMGPEWSVDFAERAVRAFNPRPGAWFEMAGDRIRVHRASVSAHSPEPGTIEVFGGAPVLGCSDGGITLDVVQPAGKAPMAGAAWMNGRRGVGGRIGASPR